MADVRFYYGSEANYNALPTKDNDTLYFLTDTLRLFKGTDEYTKSLQFVNALPTGTEARQGIIYVMSDDFSAYRFTGSSYQRIFKGYVTAIPGANPSDDNVPTTKAVADYIDAKFVQVTNIQQQYVQDVTYNSGQINVTENGSTTSTTLTGVANNVTYDSTTQVLTIPMFGTDQLSINFTQLSTVQSGRYDPDTGRIVLTLGNGNTVEIPVGSLINVYTGIATTTTTTTVNANNEIAVNVKVSAKANNAIVIENDGMYVGLPDAYTKAETEAKLKLIADSLSDHRANTVVHVTAEERATWNAKISSDELATAKGEAIAAAAADATSKANAALAQAQNYADGLNTAMNTRMTNVETAVEWHSIPNGT